LRYALNTLICDQSSWVDDEYLTGKLSGCELESTLGYSRIVDQLTSLGDVVDWAFIMLLGFDY